VPWFSCLGIVSSYAQLPEVFKEKATSAANPSGLITQLTNAIKPNSFTDLWGRRQTAFPGSGKIRLKSNGMAATISFLAGFIKPSLFTPGNCFNYCWRRGQGADDGTGSRSIKNF